MLIWEISNLRYRADRSGVEAAGLFHFVQFCLDENALRPHANSELAGY
jgi:hypothetical protein